MHAARQPQFEPGEVYGEMRFGWRGRQEQGPTHIGSWIYGCLHNMAWVHEPALTSSGWGMRQLPITKQGNTSSTA